MKIVIINGCARSGKDTFISFCQEFDPKNTDGTKQIYNISTVDPIKQLAYQIGWNGEKTERARLFLSDLKDITSAFCNYSTNWVINELKDINSNGGKLVFIHSREPEDINNLKKILSKDYEVTTLLIRREMAEERAPNNHADREVLNYNYEGTILNNTTLDNLKTAAKIYLKHIGFKTTN